MRVVTSGSAYVDIDAYAGCIAYAELLQSQSIDAIAATTAPLNESISQTVIGWQAPMHTDYSPASADTFTLVDVSDPAYFDNIVDPERVDEIVDHHPGFEAYWQEKLGSKAQIEFIGAACTLVFERWRAAGLLGRMSLTSARLLICGILDNTLNFGAKVTHQRDIDAYNDLLSRAELPVNWTEQYFSECQQAILASLETALANDTKILKFKSFETPLCVGQLVVWDANEILAEHESVIQSTLHAIDSSWFLNLVSISEGRSYFYSTNQTVRDWLAGLLDLSFSGTTAPAKRLWLRKEIIKQDIDK